MSLATLCMVALAGGDYSRQPGRAPQYRFRVVHVYPHDTSAYTEGLFYSNGVLYEGTGLEGRSGLRMLELTTARILRKTELPARYYGEGIALFGKRVFELTWKSEEGFIYNADDLSLIGMFSYKGEGWGLASGETELFMSDGTNQIRCLDPRTLRELRRIDVKSGPSPIYRINELEYVNGEILANLWMTDKIVRISPRNGHVTGWIDMDGLMQRSERPHDREAVLNGIAWDAAGKRLFVTGKLWPKLFEVKLERTD